MLKHIVVAGETVIQRDPERSTRRSRTVILSAPSPGTKYADVVVEFERTGVHKTQDSGGGKLHRHGRNVEPGCQRIPGSSSRSAAP